MKIYTIGFTQKSAEEFFTLLRSHGIQRIIDIRVHPGGQLAGFAKDRDLSFFLRELADIEYVHLPELAPTEELMKSFRAAKDAAAWESGYRRLLAERCLPAGLERSIFTEKVCCLLCSEVESEHCHRRIAADMMKDEWGDVEIVHI
jgi:uncharacterized protein (DUF488 family)